jgi:hypothetical protein
MAGRIAVSLENLIYRRLAEYLRVIPMGIMQKSETKATKKEPKLL